MGLKDPDRRPPIALPLGDYFADGTKTRVLDTSRAERAAGRRLSRRLIQDGERSYSAYSADEIIAIESESSQARPGHPYG